MSNKDDKIKITEDIGAELKETQNKLINEEGSQYKKPQLPKGAKLSKKELRNASNYMVKSKCPRD